MSTAPPLPRSVPCVVESVFAQDFQGRVIAKKSVSEWYGADTVSLKMTSESWDIVRRFDRVVGLSVTQNGRRYQLWPAGLFHWRRAWNWACGYRSVSEPAIVVYHGKRKYQLWPLGVFHWRRAWNRLRGWRRGM